MKNKVSKLTPVERLQKIEKILREAQFSGFVPQSVVQVYKIAKDGIETLLK